MFRDVFLIFSTEFLEKLDINKYKAVFNFLVSFTENICKSDDAIFELDKSDVVYS